MDAAPLLFNLAGVRADPEVSRDFNKLKEP